MRLLVKNIARIVGIESTGRLRCCGADMNKLGTLDDAWLLAADGRFAAFGRMDSLGDIAADEVVDAAGGMLFPSFCDSHTHASTNIMFFFAFFSLFFKFFLAFAFFTIYLMALPPFVIVNS